MGTATVPTLNTLPEYFYHWVATKPDFPFLRQPKGDNWKAITYAEAFAEASRISMALKQMGLEKGDHIAILSKNCYHWILADLAIMMGGFISVPLYHNLSADQLNEVLKLSDSKAVFVGKLDEWGEHSNKVPHTVKVIRFPHYEGNAPVEQGESWQELVDTNRELTMNEVHVPSTEELWTIMFTSGTTGTPKGVMHLHGTPVQIVRDDIKNDWLGIGRKPEPRFFSYLPLNHVGEKIGIYTPALYLGGTISFAESLETFAKNLQVTQPTVFFAVPRIWTKFYLGVAEKISLSKQRILFNIPILSRVIKKKVRHKLGLGNAHLVATGAAVTPAYLKKWYRQLGIHLVEAYGMTEVCGFIANSPMKDAPFDSVGKITPGCDIQVDPDTDELLLLSPYVMKGYYNNSETTASIMKNDWLCSGDKGQFDDQGFLRIIGRVSDAFKTSKGKYVTPNALEEKIEKSTLIEQVCVDGNAIPQPIALVNLSELGKNMQKEEVETALKNELDHLNAQLANYTKISTIIIDEQTWGPENELLTPTLKIRRPVVNRKFSKHYAEWHNDAKNVIWI